MYYLWYTTPPSNCQPRTVGKFDSSSVLYSNNGGVLSQNDDSSGSTCIDSSINQEGGTFNSDQAPTVQVIRKIKLNQTKLLKEGVLINKHV